MGTISMTFRRIRLLLWKNMLMRRRHYIVTTFEMLLPTVFAMLLVYIRTQVDFSGLGPSIGPDADGNTGFPEFTEYEMTSRFASGKRCEKVNCTIAFTPDNELVERLMNNLIDSFPNQENDTYEPKGFPSEKDIETYQQLLTMPGSTEMLVAAIIFESDGVLDNTTRRIAYKVRTGSTFQTDEIFPLFQQPGPDFGNQKSYYDAGVSGLQVMLDKAIINHFTGEDMTQYNISSQAMPHPEYPKLDFSQLYQFILPQFVIQGFIFMVPSIVRAVVEEKETGVKELMKMMGLPNWMHWVGWLINSMLALIISVTITVVLYFVEFSSNGAVLIHSDPTLWWFVLFVYAISGSSFCFFVSAFFQKATLGTTVGIILWIVTYQPVQLVLDPRYPDLSLGEKMLTCLLPNMALHYSFLVMCGFEAKGEGAKWSNIAETLSSNDTLSLAHVLAMFVVNTIVYITLAMYVENIMPTKYGVRKPWYYIFQLTTWYSKKSDPSSNYSGSIRHRQREDTGFEDEPTDLQVGVDIRGLRKVFGKTKVAVDNVTVKLYHGQITALLGHNGAGKTTTISMITGLYAPSCGTAYVNGNDINKDMEKVRENLGLCPQHNMLFEKLTVAEHLMFFGRLKGLTVKAARGEMKGLLKQLQLEEKENVMSMALSGGQKRKVSLGCALIGGTKVVVLDEPTSGMDPEARRAIWDLLLEMRGQRTILLTTHFMEEADVLGDRIAIMSEGKLQCCGSPMFLKQFYGAGYTLKMTLAPLGLVDRILAVVQRHIPEAYLQSQNQLNSKELSITLPTQHTRSSVFVPLFRDLSEQSIKADIETIGLSLTTMDEVFVKVGELNHNSNEDLLTSAAFFSSEIDLDVMSSSRSNLQSQKLTGFQLVCQQFWGLLLKRILYTMRKWRHFISQLLIPVALLIIAILVSNQNLRPNKPLPSLKMSFDDYKRPIIMFTASSGNNLERYLENVAVQLDTFMEKTTGNLSKGLLEIGEEDLGAFRERYVVATDFTDVNNLNAMFSTIPNHAAPLALNLVSNVLLNDLWKSTTGNETIIEMTIHPFRFNFWDIVAPLLPNPQFSQNVAILFSSILPIGLALLAATYVIFAVDERLCKAKQLQLMSGVNPIVYWASSFLWDYFMMIIVICLMCATFPIFETKKAFTNNDGVGIVFLFLAIYGFGAISFSYLFSLFVSTVPGGFALVAIIHIMTGFLNFVVDALNQPNTKSMQKVIRWLSRLFPTYGAATCSYSYSKISVQNSICELLTDEGRNLICTPGFTSPYGKIIQLCCDNCKQLGAPCFEPAPYLIWEDENTKEPGMGQELVYMIIMAAVYKLLLISIEFGIFERLKARIFKADKHSFQRTTNDEDVTAEIDRVRRLVSSGCTADDSLVIQNMCKSYGTFSAVSNLSFGVHHGECFGLLGVNGAGKTTTFRMLTGDEVRSDGNAFASMYSLQQSRKKFLSTIGYCPQFDGIIGVLSGREMLQLFCRLRGVPRAQVDYEADKWMSKLGLAESSRVECENYSGGMKRRLSAAMAMVGSPPLLLLDEPTSGVDPMARRQFWQVINSIRDAGQAIILTSHSMEECEALCTRLGIMVNGEMQCLGGVQHLKNKFAQGYSLTIKLKSVKGVTSADIVVKQLSDEIYERFHPCALKDQHQNILQFQVYNTTMPWDVLFQIMEDIKHKYANILEDYSVNGTTLEEVFLSFARKQYVAREATMSTFKKIITCQCFK